MKILLSRLMVLNAAVFFAGAALHLGLRIGPLMQPRILPAVVVEILCSISLLWGAGIAAPRFLWGKALTANLIALSGVGLGAAAMRSLALDHRIILILIALCLILLGGIQAAVCRGSVRP